MFAQSQQLAKGFKPASSAAAAHNNTVAPYTRLPRPASYSVSPHSDVRRARRDVYSSTPDRFSSRGSLDYGPPAEDRGKAQTPALTPLRAAVPLFPLSRSTRIPRRDGDLYRPDYASRPLPPRINHQCQENKYRPDYSIATTTSPLDSYRGQVTSPWAKKENHTTGKSVEPPTRRPDWGRAALSSTKPADTTLNSADRIIAGFLRKKSAKPKVQTPPKKVAEPQRRTASMYRPTRKTQGPTRLSDHRVYITWNKAALLRETNLRRLHYENEDLSYLAMILVVHDEEFCEKCQELTELRTIKDLKAEAELLKVVVHDHHRNEYQSLVTEIADELARRAVSRYNDLIRAQEVAERATESHVAREAVQVQSALPYTFMAKASGQLQRGVRVKDRAVLRKQPDIKIKTTNPELGIEEKRMASEDGTKTAKATNSQKTAAESEPKSSTTKNIRASRNENSQGSDSGYSTTTRGKPSRSPPEYSPFDDDKLPLDRSKKRIDLRRNSDHEEPKPSVDVPEKQVNNRKRPHPLDLEKETGKKSPKRSKPTLQNEVDSRKKKPHRARSASFTVANENVEVEPDALTSESKPNVPAKVVNKPPEKEKKTVVQEAEPQEEEAEEEVIVAARKTSQKRKSPASEEDEESELAPSKVAKRKPSSQGGKTTRKTTEGKPAAKTAPKQKVLKGIPYNEREPGQSYIRQPDGSWKLRKADPKSKTMADPVKRFVKD
jgi:hypothetical protein